MNTTTHLFSLSYDSNSTSINNQSWFIPVDILLIIFLGLTIILSFVFLCIILFDKTCHTVAMMLVVNSCLAALLFTSSLLWQTGISLRNDLKKLEHEDPPCRFRAYIGYVGCSEMFYSYLLQSIYRYILAVYPTRLFYQSARFQFFLIVITWICAFVCISPFILTGEIIYTVDDQICQMPLQRSVVLIYGLFYMYIIPMNSIMFIYYRLVYYVKQMSKRVTQVNSVTRAQRELRMVYRVVIIVSILLIVGFPYTVFILMGLISQPPKYHFRIAFGFVDVSLFLIIITLFNFTDPVKLSIMKRINKQKNTAVEPFK
ncbi:unnamed protein product [Adineta steineri]|uniref:G-protein coupled receptors family 1 profile domain-containing protein n=1 Tax=Adineta steineri TaxID=433720 RepID=A0A816DV02_9BILA|nr:unnamed protein product [Adineta steineri]CAF1640698.1 unnamed protein product [Adineta steineri]